MKISSDHLKNICKPGTKECCAYVVCGSKGFECGKVQLELKIAIDQRLKDGTMRAIGDNCDGPEPRKVLN